jgi:hypothetical protein
VVGHDFSWVRQTDHEFLVSGRAREVVEEEGITVVGWSRYSARPMIIGSRRRSTRPTRSA